MKFAISVTLSGWSGLTNAYTSVLSATGSFEISGASRCDDMANSLLAMRMGELRGNQLPDGVGQPGDEGLVADDGVVGSGEDVELAGACGPQVHDEGGAGVGRVLGVGGPVVGRGPGRGGRYPA